MHSPLGIRSDVEALESLGNHVDRTFLALDMAVNDQGRSAFD